MSLPLSMAATSYVSSEAEDSHPHPQEPGRSEQDGIPYLSTNASFLLFAYFQLLYVIKNEI